MSEPQKRFIIATLNFSANGGSGAPSSQQKSTSVVVTQSYSFSFTISSEVIPTRANYNFIGWARNSSATEPFKQPGDTYSFYFSPSTSDQSSSATLYAVWELKKYTITYIANGGSGAPEAQTKTHGTALTLSSVTPTRANYIFQGWSTSATGSVEYAAGSQYTNNADVVLYAVWKVASATLNIVSDVTIGTSGGAGTASWTKASESHRYKLSFSIVVEGQGASYETSYISAGSSSSSFTIPASWLNTLTKNADAVGTCTLHTYDGTTLIGSTQKSFNIIVAAAVKPNVSTVTATPHSDNNVVNGWNIVVQGYSYLTIAASASAGYGASIVNVAITGSGINKNSTDLSGNTSVITVSGSITYTVVVTDSRGRKAQKTVSVQSYEYSSPVISDLRAVRCMQNGTASDIEGNYIKAISTFSVSSVNSKNSITAKKIDYKLHTATSWTTVTTSPTSGSWTSVFGSTDTTKSYDVRCSITDKVGNTSSLIIVVPPIVGFAIGLNNDRARFGGPVEKAGLQVDWNAEFNGVIDITKRRVEKDLNTVGWKRVLTVGGSSGGFGCSGVIDLTITRVYNNTNNEVHKVSLLVNYKAVCQFVGEESFSNTKIIDKIRYTLDDSNNGHLDIYYNATVQNAVVVDYVVHNAPGRQVYFTPAALSDVAAAPSGETVKATYTFNANGTGDIKSNGVVEAYGGVTLNSMFYGGTEVPENADFNSITYLTCGVYAVKSSAIANTITNIPVNMGGRLIVVNSIGTNYLDTSGTWRYFIQYYITYTGLIYYRHVSTSGSTDLIFNSWVGIPRLDTYSKVIASQSSSRIVTKSASWTLSADDAGVFFNVSSTSTVTITIPAHSTTAFAIGTEIEFLRRNTGAVTFSPASGVTLASIGDACSISDRYGCAVLKKLETNLWVLSGALS